MPKENDLEGIQDQGGKHGGQKGMPKPEPRPSDRSSKDGDEVPKTGRSAQSQARRSTSGRFHKLRIP
jgi:hypothetical protein